MTTSLLWFRRDLRLDDHPALLAAAHPDNSGGSGPGSSSTRPVPDDRDVLGVFIADDRLLARSGLPRRNYLAGCLEALAKTMDGRLLITTGRPEEVLPRLAHAVGADTVHVSADYAPYGRARDERVGAALQENGSQLVATGSAYAVAPGRVLKPGGVPYSVFTPYFRGWTAHGWRKPAGPADGVSWLDPNAAEIRDAAPVIPADQLSAQLPPGTELPAPGEHAAQQAWQAFLEQSVAEYDDQRNRPDRPGTSRMSPYLKWGCVHPRSLLADLSSNESAGAASFRRELAFREFYADLLFHHPEQLKVSADPVIDRLQHDTGPVAEARLEAWKTGRTGYPYIDAGMRQLLAQGWIHNRARMGVASFLIKDLHLPWQVGAAHFMDHLVDGDVASNTYGWQWVAGAGPQAAPYYRIFNPVGQGEQHDPDGQYIRAFVPELAGLTGKAIHRPWESPDGPPNGYPRPIIDHATERAETLRRWGNRG